MCSASLRVIGMSVDSKDTSSVEEVKDDSPPLKIMDLSASAKASTVLITD